MDNLTTLITGAGAPGIVGTLYSLKNNFDGRKVTTVCTDIKKEVVGKYICDKFYQISKPSTDRYLFELQKICKEHNVDVIIPQNTAELLKLSMHKESFEEQGVKIIVSEAENIDVANNKYKLMQLAKKEDIPVPEFYMVSRFDDLVKYAERLGWPEDPVVLKPPNSNGMRGVRVINENKDYKQSFYEEKPSGVFTKMGFLHEVLGDKFPPLMIMGFLPGEEYTVDVLRANNITIIPRRRDLIRSGITFAGTVVKDEEIIDYSSKLAERLDLKYAFGFQFKMNKDGIPALIESNPRVQGTMVLSTIAGANIVYGAVKYAIGEEVPNFDINWGAKIYRYWGGVGVANGKVIRI